MGPTARRKCPSLAESDLEWVLLAPVEIWRAGRYRPFAAWLCPKCASRSNCKRLQNCVAAPEESGISECRASWSPAGSHRTVPVGSSGELSARDPATGSGLCSLESYLLWLDHFRPLSGGIALIRRPQLVRLAFVVALCLPDGVIGQEQVKMPMVVSIEDAVQEALDHNLVLLEERYSLSIAEARLTTARLRPNPIFSAGLDYQDVLGAGFFRDPTKGAGPSEYNARIDYLFEGGGKRGRRIEAAGAAKKVAELQLLDSMRQVVLDVQNAVVDYLLAKDNLSVARESLIALNETARLNEVRVKNGDLAQVEFLRSSVAALLFQNQVRQAQLLVYSTRNRLQLLLGRRVRFEGFDVKDTLRADHGLLVLEDLRQFALDHRPDLEALRRDQARSLAEVKSQIAQGKIDYTVGVQFIISMDTPTQSPSAFSSKHHFPFSTATKVRSPGRKRSSNKSPGALKLSSCR